jgi:predicted RNA-binding Zn ribbon-like protein
MESLPFILTLPLAGERPCLDFVNTIDWRLCSEKRRDALVTYMDLLAFVLRLNLITVSTYTALSECATARPSAAERSLADARRFRDALTIFIDDIAGTATNTASEGPSQEALAIFDAARRRAHESDSLSWKNSRLVLIPNTEEEGLDLPWLLLVRDAETLLTSSLASRIHICASEGCGWAFLDTSKNGTRRWCSMKLCGNREKASRFKAKNNIG